MAPPLPTATPVPPGQRSYYTALLRDLQLRAETSALGAAVEISWQPPLAEPHLRLRILRRERRFPGPSRRGLVPLVASTDDLGDGVLIYDGDTFAADLDETRDERLEVGRRETLRRYRLIGTPRDRRLVQTVTTDFAADGSVAQRVRRFIDHDLEPGTIYYYTAYVGPLGAFNRATQAAALATGGYGHRLFLQLPNIDRRLDTELPTAGTVALADEGKGQLERFLENVDRHADMLKGLIDGLRDLHAVRRADSRVLPLLAHLLGWQLKDYLDEDGQRNELRFASELYRSVGTFPSVVALINRLTGWDAKVREFARSVVVSFDTTRVERIASGQMVYLDGSLAPTAAYAAWLDGVTQSEPAAPHFTGRTLPPGPPGTVNTADGDAMFALRTRAFDDPNAYTYDCGKPDGAGGYAPDNDTWYNRQTVGVFIVPLSEQEVFTIAEEWERVQQILTSFLPAQVRMVFVLDPGLTVEDPYDATQEVTEVEVAVGEDAQGEAYGEGLDAGADTIPQWRWFVTNRLGDKTVNVSNVDTSARTWHTGLSQGL
ncbi:MAG TPA: phage tail protein [Polyangia bacterium]|nr:phage tail protein [Polyangia bacterium]